MNPCEKWLVVTGLTSIMQHSLERSHIYCSYLQQGRKTATSFLLNNSLMPQCSLELSCLFWTCCLNVVFRSFNKYLFHRSDYEEMPLQNGQAIRAKYKEESDSDWFIDFDVDRLVQLELNRFWSFPRWTTSVASSQSAVIWTPTPRKDDLLLFLFTKLTLKKRIFEMVVAKT